ncbi:ricin-type beta-trefoil lectin domain protein [Streptomyces sp. NPDC015131]|uniref:RICIN domain-containing protein n=1 Tax=Streptomyces sp. NPDC015131 TaxID=3364941 RepID=UPI0036F8C6CF
MPDSRPEPSAVPPPPSYAPASGASDAALAGLLGAGPGGGAADGYPAAALMARHCGAVTDYAALLTASRDHVPMVVAAAFARVLDELRHGGGDGTGPAALRPRLLVAARRTAAQWAGDPRVAALLTGLPRPAGPPPERRFAARAFAELPEAAQVLLWHREVEAEGISIPAALLAVDPRTATAALDDARELFRDGCLRAHWDLAEDQECRHYNRLLDISLRRGGALIPDIQRHLVTCRHCRFAADQLRQSGGRLALLLAEGVLGEKAREYVESRPGRGRAGAAAAGPRRAGRHSRGVPAGAVRRLAAVVPEGAARRLGALVPGGRAGAGLVVAGALAVTCLLGVVGLVGLVTEEDPPVPAAGHSAGAAPSGPGSRPPSTPAHAQTGTGSGTGAGVLTTRLRNAEGGLCLDVRDGLPRVGAELTLAACSGAPAQTWRYEPDGLLRNAAAPDLCPHSQEPSGAALLRLCATQGATTVRYDLSVQGHLVPRWHAGLGLMPATVRPGATVVVKLRDTSVSHRWLTDTANAEPAPPPAAPPPAVPSPNAAPPDAAPPAVRAPGGTAPAVSPVGDAR